jgi:hexosaminidase
MKTPVLRVLALFLFGSFELCFGASALHTQSADPALMPLPAHMTPGEGQFLIDGNLNIAFTGYTEPRLILARERFMKTLFARTGIPLPTASQDRPANFTIKTAAASKPVQELGEDETYHLKVSFSASKARPTPCSTKRAPTASTTHSSRLGI